VAADRQNQRLLYKIAHAYYHEELTQAQIAKRFGLSRIKVSRLLKQAKQSQIVHIALVPPTEDHTGLEQELERRFGIEEAVVVAVQNPKNPEAMVRELGPAAAECLIRRISGSETIGITWGTTMMSVVDSLPVHPFPDVTVVQTNGGLGPVENLEHSTELIRRIAQKFGAKSRLLNAPGVVSTREAARALRTDRHIAETLNMASKADIALVGLGILTPDSVLMRDGSILTKKDVDLLNRVGAVGDVALRYFDRAGRLLDLEINERIIGLTFDQIKAIPCVIAVAGGEKKFNVVKSALIGNIPNVLVTDRATAERLLETD
jgi:DNA-binding transcriptional regulator LsrR (DeoR family)